MSLTIKDIKVLPQSIQDLIGMFNADHRKQMEPVLRDIEWVSCECCSTSVPLKEAVYEEKCIYNWKYCSVFCFESDYYDMRKAMVKAARRM